MGTLPHAIWAVVCVQAQQFWMSDVLPKGTPAGVGRGGNVNNGLFTESATVAKGWNEEFYWISLFSVSFVVL